MGSMEDIWKGAFAPVQKHYAGTGNVRNHFKILYLVRAEEAGDYLGIYTDDEFESKGEMTLDDLHRLGEGRYEWLVGVGFEGKDNTAYNWVIARESEKPLTTQEATAIVAAEATRIAAEARRTSEAFFFND
jgi:hypothetical protein